MQDISGANTVAGADPAAARVIGRTRARVSQLGFGSAPFGALDSGMHAAVAVRAFATARDAGLRYFDTAPLYGYGLAERRLGACVDTVDRRELTLSTKVGRLLRPGAIAASAGVQAGQHPFEYTYDYSYDGALRSLEFSLQRLGTNRVDIALIHDVNRRWQGERVEERYAEAMAGAYRALHELRAQGVIDAIGVGVNDWEILLRFAADGDFDCFMLAGRYTLLDHTAGARFLPECARRGISVLMAAPFNSGILATGPVPGATYFYQGADAEILARTRRIAGVCARHGVALPAAALQFPLGHPAVASVVTGMRSEDEVAQNVDHMRVPIAPDCWRELVHEGLLDGGLPLPGSA
ncbi:MAG TPA: aldo/keto reductase [Casimicrobiaceae bacterium]|nr:aldo/keto reductase [Casimicrobiaceae bacterium]